MERNLFEHITWLQGQNSDPVTQKEKIWRIFGCNKAILVLDSSGFTMITKEFGIVHFLSALMRMRSVNTQVFKENGCGYLHCQADNIIASFNTPQTALKAAIEANIALKKEFKTSPENERLSVCIGIGYGKLLDTKTVEGFYGDEMNMASKLGEDEAGAEEILVTPAAFEGLSEKYRELFAIGEFSISGKPATYYKTNLSQAQNAG